MILTILVALFVIGFLIFIHEFGHFLAAKIMGVKVEIFSLGFGPRLIGFTMGETEYRISLIPLGGYVKLHGEHVETDLSIIKERAFAFKKPWQKAIIVIAGPLANFILPVFIFWFLFAVAGSAIIPAKVGEVLPNSPAKKAGIQKGDEILEINGKKVKSFEELILYLRSNNNVKKIKLKIKRGDRILNIYVYPEYKEGYNIFGKKTKIPFLGIKASQKIIYHKYGFLKAFKLSLEKVWEITSLTFVAIFKLFTGKLPFSTLGGPLTIGKIAGDTARLGFYPLLSFMALLSINLGIINILPLPMLDGGYLVLFAIEALRKKPLSLRTQEIIFKIGLALIIALSIAVFYNDIVRMLSGWKLP